MTPQPSIPIKHAGSNFKTEHHQTDTRTEERDKGMEYWMMDCYRQIWIPLTFKH
jgi:hypothetical protein